MEKNKQLVPLFISYIELAHNKLGEANSKIAKNFNELSINNKEVIGDFTNGLGEVSIDLGNAVSICEEIEKSLSGAGLVATLIKVQELTQLIRRQISLCEILISGLAGSDIEEYQLTQISELKLGVDTLNTYWKNYMRNNVKKHVSNDCDKN